MLRLRRSSTNFPLQPLVKEEEQEVHIQRISTDKMTVDGLYRRAEQLQENCHDHITYISDGYPHKLYIRNQDSSEPVPAFHFMEKLDESSTPAVRVGGRLTPYAFGQLCTKAGVPTSYVNKCIRAGEYTLATQNVNTWLCGENTRPFLVRMCGDHIRGLLSARYQMFDTTEVLSHLLSTDGLKDYEIKGYYLDEERFHLRAVAPKRLKVDGEDLFAGIQVDSSDVGKSSLTVMFFIFKQLCTNGLCVARGGGELFRQKHLGIDADEFNSALVSAFKRIPVLTSNVEEIIKESREIKLNHSRKAELDFISDVVKSVMTNTKMSETEAQKVVEVMREKYSETNWGLVNAITEVAQEHTLERRLELERMAGNMLMRGVRVA